MPKTLLDIRDGLSKELHPESDEVDDATCLDERLKTDRDGLAQIWVPPRNAVRLEEVTHDLRRQQILQAIDENGAAFFETNNTPAAILGGLDNRSNRVVVFPSAESVLSPQRKLAHRLGALEGEVDTESFYGYLSTWHRRGTEDTGRALGDFLEIGLELTAEAAEKRALAFAKNWGPLWQCARHWDCSWSPGLVWHRSQVQHCCAWSWCELVDAYRAKAKQMYAVLEIARRLMTAKPKKDELTDQSRHWRALYPWGVPNVGPYLAGTLADDLNNQANLLISAYNRCSYSPNSPRTILLWNNRTRRAEFCEDAGFGILGRLWLHLAQNLM
ncbi:MAG TPA: hypothetical protein VJX67_24165, partial [Blastocatellia bacterium]|nr:hypothetical protein [Blastocatellia bacterium]